MKKIIILLFAFQATVLAEPLISPTTFLNTQEPERMCDNYIHATYGDTITAWTQPSGGALVRMQGTVSDFCMYIFCDMPTHRLVIFSLIEGESGRTPASSRESFIWLKTTPIRLIQTLQLCSNFPNRAMSRLLYTISWAEE
jgi:hypothetical protein